jgi:hypothetical protein
MLLIDLSETRMSLYRSSVEKFVVTLPVFENSTRNVTWPVPIYPYKYGESVGDLRTSFMTFYRSSALKFLAGLTVLETIHRERPRDPFAVVPGCIHAKSITWVFRPHTTSFLSSIYSEVGRRTDRFWDNSPGRAMWPSERYLRLSGYVM